MTSILSRGATLLSDPSVGSEAEHDLPTLDAPQDRALAGGLMPLMASAGGESGAHSGGTGNGNKDGMK